ncbi:hypothetical protein TTRE_0000492701 [Trichuris trichiura]|uniref:Uncharacterized protein n=1 Tax=Trichuris trichiura TaxID=36087 RepID=A0A077ZDG7_TRITR|nr:hypothetical protein TTRE_0000492701 [Trichuris trichiura]
MDNDDDNGKSSEDDDSSDKKEKKKSSPKRPSPTADKEKKKKLIWTPEMRCTEVMLPKEVTEPQTKHGGASNSGPLVEQLLTKEGDDATPSKSLTSFADNTWKPDRRSPEEVDLDPSLKDAIRKIRAKVQQAASMPPLPRDQFKTQPSSVPPKQVGDEKQRAVNFQLLYGVKDDATIGSPLVGPIRRVRSMDAVSTIGQQLMEAGKLLPTMMLDHVDEVQLGVPMNKEERNSWKVALMFGSSSSYDRPAGFHKTKSFRVLNNEYRCVDTRCAYKIEPVVMLNADGKRIRVTVVHENDLLEITRCRFEKRCSDLGMNTWLRRLVLETVGIDDPDELFDDVEDEVDLIKEFPKCNLEEAIKDGLRAMLLAFDLMVNFIEYSISERFATLRDDHRALLLEFIHLSIKNFLRDSAASSLASMALVRGNDEHVMSTLFGRLLEWTDLVGEKLNQVPDFLHIPEAAYQKDVADSEKKGSVLADHFLPQALKACSLFRRWCESYSTKQQPKAEGEAEAASKTPAWLADDIRNAYEANLVEGDLKATIPFFRFMHKAEQVETDRCDLPYPDWHDLMITCNIRTKRKAAPPWDNMGLSADYSKSLLHSDQTKTAVSAVSADVGSPEKVVTKTAAEDRKVIGAPKTQANANDAVDKTKQGNVSPQKGKNPCGKLPPIPSPSVRPSEKEVKPAEPKKQVADHESKIQQPISDPALLKDLKFLEANPPEDCTVGRREASYPGEVASSEEPQDLIDWATETMRKFYILQKAPLEQQAEMRDRFLREQSARLKRCREKWRFEMERRQRLCAGEKLTDYERIRKGVRDKVMFRRTTPVPFEERSIRLDCSKKQAEKKMRDQETQTPSHASFVDCLWNFMKSSSSGSPTKPLPKVPETGKVSNGVKVVCKLYRLVNFVNVHCKVSSQGKSCQGRRKSFEPSQEEVTKFINEITYGLDSWPPVQQAKVSHDSPKGVTQQDNKQQNKRNAQVNRT